jgi:hypothetical protein
MNKPDDISELRAQSEDAEQQYQRAMKARKVAVAAAAQALQAAAKARRWFLRAQAQVEGEGA